VGLLDVAVRTLPLGTAYAVSTELAPIGAAVLGIHLLREPATPVRLFIVAGIAGLKLATPTFAP
jgi:quaternary ammonium compound-resistance protein SugE